MILKGGGGTLLMSFVSPAIYVQKILYLNNGIFGGEKKTPQNFKKDKHTFFRSDPLTLRGHKAGM